MAVAHPCSTPACHLAFRVSAAQGSSSPIFACAALAFLAGQRCPSCFTLRTLSGEKPWRTARTCKQLPLRTFVDCSPAFAVSRLVLPWHGAGALSARRPEHTGRRLSVAHRFALPAVSTLSSAVYSPLSRPTSFSVRPSPRRLLGVSATPARRIWSSQRATSQIRAGTAPAWQASFLPATRDGGTKTVFDERKDAALAAIAPREPSPESRYTTQEDTRMVPLSLPPASFRPPRPRLASSRTGERDEDRRGDDNAGNGEEGRAGAADRLGRPTGHRRDKSRKGSVDEEIRPLLDTINRLKNFYTASSCAGRVLLVGTPARSHASPEQPTPLSLSAASSARLPSCSPSGSASLSQAASPAAPRAPASSSATDAAQQEPPGASQKTGDEPAEGQPGEDGRRKKHSFVFLLNHHQTVDARRLLHAIVACPIPCDEIWLKVESPILHICCRSLADALNLMRVARAYTHRAVLLHASSLSPVSPESAETRSGASAAECAPTNAASSSAASPCHGEQSEEQEALRLPDARRESGFEERDGSAEPRTAAGDTRKRETHEADASRRRGRATKDEERGRDNGRYIVELSNGGRVAMPVLLDSATWIAPLPSPFKERAMARHSAVDCGGNAGDACVCISSPEAEVRGGRGADQSVTQSQARENLDSVDTRAAEDEHVATGQAHSGESPAVGAPSRGRPQSAASSHAAAQAGSGTRASLEGADRERSRGDRGDETGKEAQEDTVWERWEALAARCNKALEESRSRFFQLEKELNEMAERNSG